MICKKAIALIKCFESLHDGDMSHLGLQPKMCPAGIWTIGYGRALRDKKGTRFLKGDADKAEAYEKYPNMTVEQAESLLALDIEYFEKGVRNVVTVDLTEDQLGALTSFTYNIGLGNFEKSTLLKKLNAGDIEGAADEFLRWNKSGYKVLNGLTRRREAERNLFLSRPYTYVSTH